MLMKKITLLKANWFMFLLSLSCMFSLMQRLLNILCKDCLQYEKSELIIRLLVVFASTETKKTKMKE